MKPTGSTRYIFTLLLVLGTFEGAMAGAELFSATPSVRLVLPPGYDTGGLAFRQLFEQPDQWSETRDKIDSIGYYDHRVNVFTDEELTAWFAQMQAWGKKFFIETGALNEWCTTGEDCFNAIHPLYDRFLSLGADIDAFAMDEPFFKARYFGVGNDAYAVREVADWISLVRQNYPGVAVGSIEPYPSVTMNSMRWWIVQIESALSDRGTEGFDFFCVDPDWRRFPRDGNWGEVKQIESFCRNRGLSFSLIYWGSETPESAQDLDWFNGIMKQGQDYYDVGGLPDEYDLQSWLAIPINGVPETDTNTVTGAAKVFIETFVGAPTATPRPTSTPSNTRTPTFTRTATLTATPTPTPSNTSTLTPTPTESATFTPSLTPTQSPSRTPTPTPTCYRSDLNCDGKIDALDLLVLRADWEKATGTR